MWLQPPCSGPRGRQQPIPAGKSASYLGSVSVCPQLQGHRHQMRRRRSGQFPGWQGFRQGGVGGANLPQIPGFKAFEGTPHQSCIPLYELAHKYFLLHLEC